jgi:hypothetical protein
LRVSGRLLTFSILRRREDRWRELVSDLKTICKRADATPDVIEGGRSELRNLVGDIVLMPSSDGSHPKAQDGLKAQRLVRGSPSESVYKIV